MLLEEKLLKIQSKIQPDSFIIVEGKRDKESLEKLGFKNIITISGKTNEKLLQKLKERSAKKVLILTDFDSEGASKYKELCKFFERAGVKNDSYSRLEIKKLFRIHKIEELKKLTKFIRLHPITGRRLADNKNFRKVRFHKRNKKKYKKR